MRKKDSNLKTRKQYKVTLGSYHIGRLVWAYRREINEDINRIKHIKNLDEIQAKSKVLTSVALHPLYENLSILEPVMECYLAGRDGKNSHAGFNIGDGELFDILSEIRSYIETFPPQVESFYQNYKDKNERLLKFSPVCIICNKHGARMYYSNAKVHNECLSSINAKYCEYCANLYVRGKEKCTNKPECSNYQLKDAKSTNDTPHGAISVQIPKEQADKIEKEIKEERSNYKGGGN